jgi:hypothetical protein
MSTYTTLQPSISILADCWTQQSPLQRWSHMRDCQKLVRPKVSCGGGPFETPFASNLHTPRLAHRAKPQQQKEKRPCAQRLCRQHLMWSILHWLDHQVNIKYYHESLGLICHHHAELWSPISALPQASAFIAAYPRFSKYASMLKM